MNARDREVAEYREKLLKLLKPGDTVYTILRHRSRSGMSRRIGVAFGQNGDFRDWDGWVAAAVGMRWDRDNGGVIVQGCGMDMGFHLVYNLSATLFRDGFGCVGEKCPSNDHLNGDRDYTPHMSDEERSGGADGKPCSCHREHWHKDGGYALRQRWI